MFISIPQFVICSTVDILTFYSVLDLGLSTLVDALLGNIQISKNITSNVYENNHEKSKKKVLTFELTHDNIFIVADLQTM
jgi:hypothetical protein